MVRIATERELYSLNSSHFLEKGKLLYSNFFIGGLGEYVCNLGIVSYTISNLTDDKRFN